MSPEGVRRIGGASRQVVVKGRLPAQRLPGPDPARLLPLGLPDPMRGRKDLLGVPSGDEEGAVVVG
jgi:hypothetical protein